MKLTAAGVVVLGLVLAGCSSGGGAAQSTVTATATVTTSAADATTSAPEPTPTALGITEQCRKLLTPVDTTGVPVAIQAQVVVSTAAMYPTVVPPLKSSAVEALNRYLQDALSVAGAQLVGPLSTMVEQVGYVLTAVNQSQTLNPTTSATTIKAAVDQVKTTCQGAGVVVPTS